MTPRPQVHPRHSDWDLLTNSWTLSLRADGYSPNTLNAYRTAVAAFADWLASNHPGLGPADVERSHVREWIVATREATSSGTARSHFAGVRHFFRWAVAEDEAQRDPTDGIRTPAPNDARTDLIPVADLKALLDTCGRDFIGRRDSAIIHVFAFGGLRLSECAGLALASVNLVDGSIEVVGKGTNRSGPRRRAVTVDVKAVRALDRYIRERRRHPYAATDPLWLGDRNRPRISPDGIDAMLQRRAAKAGIGRIHPHQFRHTWADAYRTAGGADGELMTAGGWRNRQMLDRYGRAGAEARAAETARRIQLYGGQL